MSNLRLLRSGLAIGGVLVQALAGCGGGGDSASTLAGVAALPNTSTSTPATVAGMTAFADSAAMSCGLNQPAGIAQEMLSRVNQVRSGGALCGSANYPPAPTLQWNNELLQAAAGHSADMAASNYFSHVSLDERTPAQRLKQTGYDYSSMGENIAAGQTSVETVVAAWVASPDHCKNLMNPVFRDIGVACVAKPGTTYDRYWAMELGREF